MARGPSLHVYLNSKTVSVQYQFKFKIPFKDDKPATTILRKWLPFCLSVDFVKQEAQVSYGGVLSNKEKPHGKVEFGDKYMLKDVRNPNNNFTIRIGRYYFDSLSMVGNIAGINIWNTTLAGEDLARLTDCRSVTVGKGNKVNQGTTWHTTAPLVEEYEQDIEGLFCREEKEVVSAFLPVNSLSYDDAVDMCHKFGPHVDLAGDFKDEKAFKDFYDLLWSKKADKFREEDSFINRGRLRMWFPYKILSMNQTNKVVHTSSGSELGVDAWKNDKQKVKLQNPSSVNLCVGSYMGIRPYKQNLELRDCSISDSSAGCTLNNSFNDTTSLVLRGLCKFSVLDTLYMVEYTK